MKKHSVGHRWQVSTNMVDGTQRYLTLLSALIVGITLSISGMIITQSWEMHNLEVEFRHRADQGIAAFQRELDVDIEVLQDLHALYMASRKVERHEFAAFTRPILSRHRNIQALEWSPRVSLDERAAYEEHAQREGMESFSIKERQNGQMINAVSRPEYFPVFFLEPLAGNETALGFDLGSSAVRRETLQLARDSGRVVSTAPVTLVQEKALQKSILMAIAVYSGEPHNVAQRRQALQGFVLGVYRIGDLFDTALARTSSLSQDVVMTLYDITDPITEQLLHVNNSDSEISDLLGDGYRDNIELAGRTWSIVSQPTVEFVNTHTSWHPLAVMATGLTLTLLLSYYLYNITTREQQIKALVAQRTQELESSESRNQAIVEAAMNAILTTDTYGTVRQFNQGAEKMFGYQAQEIIGNNIKLIMPKFYHTAHEEYLSAYRKIGKADVVGTSREVYGKHRDGTIFPIELAVGESGQGDARLLVGIITDITARKESEQILLAAKEQAEQSNNLKSEFINMISHELRTPLTVILGYLPLLKDEKRLPPPALITQIATDIQLSGNHLLELINGLLNLSRLEAGYVALNREMLSIPEFIEDIVNTLQIKADQKGIDLHNMATTGTVWADRTRLKQILINLVGNAIKFTCKGSVRIETCSINGATQFKVHDSGCGIDAENLDLIFDKFHQVDSSSTRTEHGSGLGLAITRYLVTLHGGEISVKSTPQLGSTFTFTIANEEKHIDGKHSTG